MQNNISQITKIVLITEILVAFYMIVALGRSVYENYQIENYISETETKNEEIVLDIEQLEHDIAYYKSPQYIDKIAKQNDNKVSPGEKVLIIEVDEVNATDFEEKQLAKRLNYLENLPPLRKWMLLLQGD